MNEEIAENAANRVIEIIAGLASDDERMVVIGLVKSEYCMHCGSFHGDQVRQCQCWNDQ